MNEILEVHERDMDVVVQPGMPYELLNEELKERGLFFPVDVSLFLFLFFLFKTGPLGFVSSCGPFIMPLNHVFVFPSLPLSI